MVEDLSNGSEPRDEYELDGFFYGFSWDVDMDTERVRTGVEHMGGYETETLITLRVRPTFEGCWTEDENVESDFNTNVLSLECAMGNTKVRQLTY